MLIVQLVKLSMTGFSMYFGGTYVHFGSGGTCQFWGPDFCWGGPVTPLDVVPCFGSKLTKPYNVFIGVPQNHLKCLYKVSAA